MSQFPTIKQVAGSAIGSRAASWHSRTSKHSRTGAVLVAVFSSRERAAVFAKRWAQRLGISMFFRVQSGAFLVSVPVVA
jgi:hypothetical protein